MSQVKISINDDLNDLVHLRFKRLRKRDFNRFKREMTLKLNYLDDGTVYSLSPVVLETE